MVDKVLLRYPEKTGLLWVLNIRDNKALEGREMIGHVTHFLSTELIVLEIANCSFILQKLNIHFPKMVFYIAVSSFKRMSKVGKKDN